MRLLHCVCGFNHHVRVNVDVHGVVIADAKVAAEVLEVHVALKPAVPETILHFNMMSIL
jgi:hypothetical protein